MSKKRQKPKNIVKHASVSTCGGSGYRQRSASAGGTELVITGIVDCRQAEIDSADVAHAILSTVLPSFNNNDIVNARQTAPSTLRGKTSRVDVDGSTAVPGNKKSRPPPFIV